MKFKVYTTDGKDIWEIFFIKQDKNGDFYFGGIYNGKMQVKSSRHVSGKYHTKSNDDTIYMDHGERENLKVFTGFEALGRFSLSPKNFNKSPFGKTYSGGKVTGSAFIDIRNYDKSININTFLLEPSKTERLFSVSDSMENGQLIIFTQTNPWIVLTVMENFKD
jgi:hypothetical protein